MRQMILMVTMMGLLWGLNWPAVKFLLTELPPITMRAIAFTCAAALLAGLSRVRGEALWPRAQEIPAIATTGLFLIFGFNILTAIGQTLTETSKAAIIAYTMPAMTAGLAVLLLGERPDRRRVAALVIGTAGLAVLASENLGALIADPLGPAIMLAAAFAWSLGNISLKARIWRLPSLALTVWFFAVSAVLSWPLAIWLEGPILQNWPSPPVLATLVFHITGPMVVSYALWTVLVGRLTASVAAIAALLAPVVGVVSSIILLGDPVSWQKVVSLTMILASIFLTLSPAKPASPPSIRKQNDPAQQ